MVVAKDFSVRYPGRSEPAVDGFTAALVPGAALVLATPSGTGKSSIIAALAGILPAGEAGAETFGELLVRNPDAVVYASQHPVFTEENVAAEVALYAAGPEELEVEPGLVAAVLGRVNAAHLAGRAVVDCSPGELRRVAVARALARIAVDPAVELALLDEPTAHLDPVSAQAVRTEIVQLQGRVAVVVATHDPLLAHALSAGAPAPAGEALGAAGSATATDTLPAASAEPAVLAQPASVHGEDVAAAGFKWRHLRALPLLSPRFAAGVLVSALATLSAAALSGFSGWLIVWAAAPPPILYLMTLIVGVRAFGIGRSVLRYSERLLTHDAVFRWAAELRLKLWDSLGSSVLHWGKLTRSGGALGTLVADVDELRDAVPRVVVPIPAALISYGAVLLTVFLLVPEATGIVVLLGLLALVLLPLLVLAAQRRASAAAAVHRIWLAERALVKIGLRNTLVSGQLAGALGIALVCLALPTGAGFWWLLPGIFILSLGQGMTWTAMWVAAGLGVKPGEQGVAAGMASTTQQIGGALGLAVLVSLANASGATGAAQAQGIELALWWSAGIALAGAGVAMRLRAPRQDAIAEAT